MNKTLSSKSEQKQELARLLAEVWRKRDGSPDNKMIEHCLKSSYYVYVNGLYVDVGEAKPSIRTDLWYDDEQEDPGASYDRFIWYNERFQQSKYQLSGVSFGRECELYFARQYSSQISSTLVSPQMLTGNESHIIRKVTANELIELNRALDAIRVDYRKRLDRYWNRYNDKISSRGYWVNR